MTSPLEDAYRLARRDDPLPPSIGEETLRYLGYDPRSLESHALILLCDRYRLDPLLGHVQLITVRGGRARPYVTRDGMLEVAHRSGVFDGMTTVEERRNSTGDGWTAYVSVWRKDMAHPFTYGAQCKDGESQARDGHGPEMALARAERRALRRAFNIPAYDDDGVVDVDAVEHDEAGEGSVSAPVPPSASTLITDDQRAQVIALMAELGVVDQSEQLRYAGELLGRTIREASKISETEGAELIAQLQRTIGDR